MDIIVPAAGLSSRFPGLPPKYLLEDCGGQLMIERAVAPFMGVGRLTVALLAEHVAQWRSLEILRDRLGSDVVFVVLDARTRGPADTLDQVLAQTGIQGPVLVKDCDNYWTYDHMGDQNAVWTAELGDYPQLTNVAAKSYVVANDQDLIVGIVEKQVVSSSFVVGGYQFRSAAQYRANYAQVAESQGELYISRVIDHMLDRGTVFLRAHAREFVDVGTLGDWQAHNGQ